MSEEDRPLLVEIATMVTGCSREFCQKMSIKELEIYYRDHLEEGTE